MTTTTCKHGLLNNQGSFFRCSVGCGQIIKAICIMRGCSADAFPLDEKEHGPNYYLCSRCGVKQHITS